jgi:hypothetical protein
MIRSWVALAVVLLGMPALALAVEELPAPKVRAADVPPPPVANPPVANPPVVNPSVDDVPMSKAAAPDLPVPAIDVPAKPAETQPADKPALNDPLPKTESPPVVAPSTILPDAAPKASSPASAFPSPAPLNPQPAPSVIVPTNPNPSGTTPALPGERAFAPATELTQEQPNNNVPDDLRWRYKWHNGQWWYWSPDERWMIWDKNAWIVYDPATYQAPVGFARPGPRVVTSSPLNAVTRQSLPPLPERYSGAEVSVPESYYIAPTPYAFGADSYYGPNGPAASYYNRRSGLSITLGSTPAYVPLYDSYLAPQYFSNPRYGGARYTAPVGVYPGYVAPGFYGGRGVTIGFGF